MPKKRLMQKCLTKSHTKYTELRAPITMKKLIIMHREIVCSFREQIWEKFRRATVCIRICMYSRQDQYISLVHFHKQNLQSSFQDVLFFPVQLENNVPANHYLDHWLNHYRCSQRFIIAHFSCKYFFSNLKIEEFLDKHTEVSCLMLLLGPGKKTH